MEKTVVELFAGVGGFRVGLNDVKSLDDNGLAIEKSNFNFVWANQWEPSTTKQFAYECYKKRFNAGDDDLSNQDISLVEKNKIPNHNLLCGGFPCQDYSVARSLSGEKGINGKKGVLWWQIVDILKAKKPAFVLLENVDRLLKSPSSQRGRDFAIMLRCFCDNGYGVEWRVVNAADYGHPQRRRRVYIFAFRETTNYYKTIKKAEPSSVLFSEGFFSKIFPVEQNNARVKTIELVAKYSDLVEVSNRFSGKFEKTGLMLGGKAFTCTQIPIKAEPIVLRTIAEKKVDNTYYLNEDKIAKFKYLRGSKKVLRKKPNGETYYYCEGSMSETDSLSLPGRTMLTSEGTVNRSTHIIKDKKGIRILTPLECERLNQFPDNWTQCMPERKRYFMMGNALVCGIINKIGTVLSAIMAKE